MIDLPPRTPPTIRDVAALAGVSIATVSRVINGKDIIRTQTAYRVRQAVEELGFRPNRIGQCLKIARSHTLGVLLSSLSDPMAAGLLQGIQEAGQEAGYPLVLAATDERCHRSSALIGDMLAQQVDGLLLSLCDADDNPVLDRLDDEGIAYVLLDHQPQRAFRAAVGVDSAGAARDIVRWLMAKGHSHIGMVIGVSGLLERSSLLQGGFLVALAQAGLAPGPVLESDYHLAEFPDRLASVFLDSATPPTALLCSNDMIALATIAALRRIGRSVPEDVSVVGFDGIPAGEWSWPSLATVIQPARQMGIVAARQLLARLRGHAQPERILLPYSLRDGGSVGSAP